MDALEAIKKRHSTRNFDGSPVPKGELEKIVDAGRLAPSAMAGFQWEFIAVTGRDRLQMLAEICDYGKFLKNAGAAIIVVCKNAKFYLEDGCAATENILIAATALGIDSCWIAGDKKKYAETVLKLAGAPGDFKLVSILALGYPSKKTVPTKKRTLKEVLHWEKF